MKKWNSFDRSPSDFSILQKWKDCKAFFYSDKFMSKFKKPIWVCVLSCAWNICVSAHMAGWEKSKLWMLSWWLSKGRWAILTQSANQNSSLGSPDSNQSKPFFRSLFIHSSNHADPFNEGHVFIHATLVKQQADQVWNLSLELWCLSRVRSSAKFSLSPHAEAEFQTPWRALCHSRTAPASAAWVRHKAVIGLAHPPAVLAEWTAGQGFPQEPNSPAKNWQSCSESSNFLAVASSKPAWLLPVQKELHADIDDTNFSRCCTSCPSLTASLRQAGERSCR